MTEAKTALQPLRESLLVTGLTAPPAGTTGAEGKKAVWAGPTCSLRLGHEGFAEITLLEEGGSLQVVPLLLQEGVPDLFLPSLLALAHALVLADCHLR